MSALHPARLLTALLVLAAPAAFGAEVITVDGTLYGAFKGIDVEGEGALLRIGDRSAALEQVVAVEFAPPPDRLEGDVALATTGGDLLPGTIDDGDAESVTLGSALLGRVVLPLDHLRAVFYPANLPAGCSGARLRRDLLDGRDEDDLALLTTGTRLKGTFEKLGPEGLRFTAEALGQVLLEPARVQGAVLAVLVDPPVLPFPHVVLHLNDGARIAGRLLGATPDAVRLAPRFAESLSVPVKQLAALHVVGGRSVFLSDLEPAEVLPVPYFGDALAEWDSFYKPDASWEGCPLSMHGKVYPKGVGVHSRCELVYALDGAWLRFVALVGLDDRARRRPDVRPSLRFIVEVDGERRFDSGLLDRDDPPREVGVELAGARSLRLICDFGDNADVLGHGDWAMARLIRP